jgi:HEAT repeat protein
MRYHPLGTNMIENLHTLTEQLHHPDRNVRGQAALNLGKSGDISALPFLLDALVAEPDLFVREDITWAVVRMGDDALLPLIALLEDANPAARHHAAHVLSKIGDQRATGALINALQDSDAKVVLKAAHALGQLGAFEAIPALVGLLGHENREVQTTLATTLEGFGEAALPRLIEALSHAQWQVREHAADILGLIANREVVPALVALLGDSQWQVRFAAVNALGSIGGAQAKAALRQHNDSHEQVCNLLIRLKV